MLNADGTIGKKVLLVAILGTALSLLLISSQDSFADLWKAPWNAGRPVALVNPATLAAQQGGKTLESESTSWPSSSDAATLRDTATSTLPKLFWGDGDPVSTIVNDGTTLNHGAIYSVDPGTAPIARLLYDTDSYFIGEKGELEGNGIPTATLDANLMVSNLKIAYFYYLKNGRIFLVDTTTLAKKQLSTETGLTPGNICDLRTLIDWKTPTNTTITYTLKGADGTCNTFDDVTRAVKLSMTATSAPTTLTRKKLGTILLDGRYIAADFSGVSPQVQVCTSTLVSCTNLTTFSTSAFPMHFNATNVLLNVDGSLWRYTTNTGLKVKLFTPTATQRLSEARLDRDSAVYFTVVSTSSPFTNTIRKVAPNTMVVTTLATFTTPIALDHLDFSLSPTYLVYSYPNTEDSGAFVRAVLKSPPGGTPTIYVLADNSVNGGVVGGYFFFEDKLGQLNRVTLTGAGKITLAGTQLSGATMGGKGDWFYQFDTTTFRGIFSTGPNLKSFTYAANFTVAGVPTALGTLPVNLSNPKFMATGYDLIGTAQRRGTEFSHGRDVPYLKAATAASLIRLTNNNGEKLVTTAGF